MCERGQPLGEAALTERCCRLTHSVWGVVISEFPHEVLRVLDAFFVLDDDPAKTQLETASEAVYISFRRAFYLHHPTYHVAYEDFDMAEVSDQSVLTVCVLASAFCPCSWGEGAGRAAIDGCGCSCLARVESVVECRCTTRVDVATICRSRE